MMKCPSTMQEGDIVCPVPSDVRITKEALMLHGGSSIRHGDDFNATIISNFLVAVKPMHEDDEVVLNMNLTFYDIPKESAHLCDGSPPLYGFRYLSETEQQLLYRYADESVRQQAISNGFVPDGQEGGIRVVRSTRDTLVAVSSQEHQAGAVVFDTSGVLLPFPVRSTVEVPGDMHLRLTGGSEFIRHSCFPNLRLEIQSNQICGVALRSIEEGEVLTYNYLCTESEITKVFHCSCNKYCCYGIIKGFKFLDKEQQAHLLPHCSPAVKEKHRAPLLEASSHQALVSATSLYTTAVGCIAVQHRIPAGTMLLDTVSPPLIQGNELILGQLHFPHSCDANTVMLEGRLVTTRGMAPGDGITVNLNLLRYTFASPIVCRCGAPSCMETICGFSALPDDVKARLWSATPEEVRMDALRDNYRIPSMSPLVIVGHHKRMGQIAFAARNISRGTRIFHTTGLVIPFATVSTIYLGKSKHLLFSGGSQCVGHSCRPNTRIVVDPVNGCFDCFAIDDISDGDVLTYNYLTTEWDMQEPFFCAGNHEGCYGRISGFRHLSPAQQLRLWPMATVGVRSLCAQTSNSLYEGSAILDRELLAPRPRDSALCVTEDLPSGTILFEAPQGFSVKHGIVTFGDFHIDHSCRATAALLGNKVVLVEAMEAGTPVTLNINQLEYDLPSMFTCTCGEALCVGRVGGFKHLPESLQDSLLLCTLPEVRAAAVRDGYTNKSCCSLVSVRSNGDMGQATFAAKPIVKGSRFFHVTGLVLPFPTVYSILIDPGHHLQFGGGAQCLAHSCDPNVRVMVDTMNRTLFCLALRDIGEGEIISFNYLATEWDMSTPFRCICGSKRCFGKISGFRHRTSRECQLLWAMATPAIRHMAQCTLGSNWKSLASPLLRTDTEGHVCAGRELLAGKVLFSAAKAVVSSDGLIADGILIRYRCHANAAMIENQIVLVETVCDGAEITVDLACFSYTLKEDSMCHCSAQAHPHQLLGFGDLSDEDRKARLIFTQPPVRVAALRDGLHIDSSGSMVNVKPSGEIGLATFAAKKIAMGTRFLRTEGLTLPFPTDHTTMLTGNRHLLLGGVAQFLAHSCDPNVKICVDDANGVCEYEALRDIQADELIAFNYNTSEWSLRAPFRCLCGTPQCVYDIRGFQYLSRAQQQHILPLVTQGLREAIDMQMQPHPLPAPLRSDASGNLRVVADIPKETVLMQISYMDIQPTHLDVGRGYVVPHSITFNCVLVEGRLVTCRSLTAGEVLTVNMNYFVYDMTSIYPQAFTETCKGFKFLDEAVKQRGLYLCEPPVRAQAMRDGWIVKSSQEAVEVRPNGDMGQTAYAVCDIPEGTTLYHCTGLIIPFPTMYTICVSDRKHLLFGNAAECIAHHCDPNVQVKVNPDASLDFVTIKAISKGDLVTFNYNTTEWDMNSPFPCLCGSEKCAKHIKGFKYLDAADRQRLLTITTDFVKSMCT